MKNIPVISGKFNLIYALSKKFFNYILPFSGACYQSRFFPVQMARNLKTEKAFLEK